MMEVIAADNSDGWQSIDRALSRIDSYPELLSKQPSKIAQDSEIERLNNCVDPLVGDTLVVSLHTALDCMYRVGGMLRHGPAPSVPVAVTLTRTALVGYGHVAYVLLPEESEEREEHASRLMSAQLDSEIRFSKYVQSVIPKTSNGHEDLRPTSADTGELQERREALIGRIGEGPTIINAAELLVQIMIKAGYPEPAPSTYQGVRDLLGADWQLWSGVAHAWFWPYKSVGFAGDQPWHWPHAFELLAASMSLIIDTWVSATKPMPPQPR